MTSLRGISRALSVWEFTSCHPDATGGVWVKTTRDVMRNRIVSVQWPRSNGSKAFPGDPTGGPVGTV